MPAQSDWLPLSDVLDRLDIGEVSAARDIIGRGQIPVTAIRSDIPGGTNPERVETLLAQATQTQISFGTDRIAAHFGGSPTDWIEFSGVRVDWWAVVERLAAAGFQSRKSPPHRSGPQPLLPQIQIREPAQRPGPKAGETTPKDLACETAVQILDDDDRRPPRGYGRLIKLARLVNTELRTRGHQYQDDSIRRMIGPTLREWEAAHPTK
jgi:hypothetical protein